MISNGEIRAEIGPWAASLASRRRRPVDYPRAVVGARVVAGRIMGGVDFKLRSLNVDYLASGFEAYFMTFDVDLAAHAMGKPAVVYDGGRTLSGRVVGVEVRHEVEEMSEAKVWVR